MLRIILFSFTIRFLWLWYLHKLTSQWLAASSTYPHKIEGRLERLIDDMFELVSDSGSRMISANSGSLKNHSVSSRKLDRT
jgi:hypothetical protein